MACYSLSPLCYCSIQILVDKINLFLQNWRALIPRPHLFRSHQGCRAFVIPPVPHKPPPVPPTHGILTVRYCGCSGTSRRPACSTGLRSAPCYLHMGWDRLRCPIGLRRVNLQAFMQGAFMVYALIGDVVCAGLCYVSGTIGAIRSI